MNSMVISSPSKTKQPPSIVGGGADSTKSRFIHTFGYHLATKMLGSEQVNECIRQACTELQQEQEDPIENPCRCYRANWRSNVHFPWDLTQKCNSDAGNMKSDTGVQVVEREALFIDLTFDFIVFPVEIVDEGRTNSCHVLKLQDLWDGQGDEHVENGMEDAIAISVSVRIGALAAILSAQSNDDSNSANEGKSAGGKDEEYQYYYHRGDTEALTVSDLDGHCQGIDIVLEDMDAANVAGLLGDAFLDGRSGNRQWQLMMKPGNDPFSLTTIDGVDNTANCLRWYAKVHHEKLQATGPLPLSYNNNVKSDPIDRCMLDMILLQSNNASSTSVPKEEAFVLWKNINPAIIRALERPVEPSPKKMSPLRSITAASERASSRVDESNKSNKPKATIRRPPKPQPAGLFARGKKTTLGGSRRKKQKFTFKDT